MAGDAAGAQRLLRDALASVDGPAQGSVTVVLVGDASDLLSLRAVRALAEADAVILDPLCPPGVAGMARRDARRLAGPDTLADLAAAGERLVWVVAGREPSGAGALRTAGVRVIVLSPAPA